MADLANEQSAQDCVEETTTTARWMGGGFIILGLVTIVGGWNPAARLASHLLLVADTLVLIGPGVWYFVAAPMIRQLDVRAVRVTQYVIFAQLAVMVLLIPIDLIVNGFTTTTMILPGIFAFGFIPALVVLILGLRDTRKAIQTLSPPGRGFEPIPVAPIARSETEGTADAPAAQK